MEGRRGEAAEARCSVEMHAGEVTAGEVSVWLDRGRVGCRFDGVVGAAVGYV